MPDSGALPPSSRSRAERRSPESRAPANPAVCRCPAEKRPEGPRSRRTIRHPGAAIQRQRCSPPRSVLCGPSAPPPSCRCRTTCRTSDRAPLEFPPVIADLHQFLAQATFWRNGCTLPLQPYPEVLDQRRGARLAHGQTHLGGFAADLVLDGVHLSDPLQAFHGHFRAVLR